jgi:hypothetical protein
LESKRDVVKGVIRASLQRERFNSLVFACEEALDYKARYLKEYRKRCHTTQTRKGHFREVVEEVTTHPMVEGAGKAVPTVREFCETAELVADVADTVLDPLLPSPDPLSPSEEFALDVMATVRTFYHSK